MSSLLPLLLLFLLIAGCSGVLAYLAFDHVKGKRLAAVESARRLEQARQAYRADLVQSLRKNSFEVFRVEDVTQRHALGEEAALLVRLDIYRQVAKKVVSDGVITLEERAKLDRLQSALKISDGDAESLEREEKADRYRKEAAEVLADGVVTEVEAEELASLRLSLGLDSADVVEVAGELSAEAYANLLRGVIRRGEVTPDAKRAVERFRSAFALTKNEAAGIILDSANDLYRECYASVVADGEVTSKEEELFSWLESQVSLTPSTIKEYRAGIEKIKACAAYRRGQLPSIQTRRILESGEICHWESRGTYQYLTTTREQQLHGELVVSSKKVYFHSAARNLSFAPSRVQQVGNSGRWVYLQVDGRVGTGHYEVPDPALFEAIMLGLVNRSKYRIVNSSADMTRHIPPHIRQIVWHRDGGRCVQCDANDYLEFDHIIPHSKGGANTERNIQLLCRRCNQQKSDRI